MTHPARAHAALVEALGSAVRSGDHGLKTVPALLKRVLAEGAWREFTTQRGEEVRHERFADFVTAKPLRGIGGDLDLIRRVISDDREALDLLDQALQNPVGTNSGVDIINTHAPRGTSREYALRRLRKDAPEMHAAVLAGDLTPHAAMVAAGLTRRRFTVVVTTPEAVANTIRSKVPAEMLPAVLAHLAAVASPDNP
jgi:hypothetical protein